MPRSNRLHRVGLATRTGSGCDTEAGSDCAYLGSGRAYLGSGRADTGPAGPLGSGRAYLGLDCADTDPGCALLGSAGYAGDMPVARREGARRSGTGAA
jgi:hypothetical protein